MTLIEILVVILISGLLVSLLMGAIKDVRSRARASKSLSNLRTHAQAFSAYSTDFREFMPFFTRPGFASTTLQGGGLTINGVSFFDAHRTWHIALADAYYSAPATSEVFFAPTDLLSRRHTTYGYPCVFITDPRYWDEHTRTGAEQWRPTKLGDVLTPTAKTLVVHMPLMQDDGNYPRWNAISTAFCDGSAHEVPWSETLNGYGLGDGYTFQSAGAIHYNDMPRLLHTMDGVRGKDVR